MTEKAESSPSPTSKRRGREGELALEPLGTASLRQGESTFLPNVLLFVRQLRAAGLPVSLDQTMSFVEALGYVDLGSREQVFCSARALLVTRHQDRRLFELLFDRFWSRHGTAERGLPQKAPRAPRHAPEPRERFTIATYLAQKARPSDPEVDVVDRAETYSDTELLQQKDFSEMTPEELDTVKLVLREMRWRVSERRTHRLVSDPRGSVLDARRAMADTARYGKLPLRLGWRGRKVKQRRVVVLADISGSMERYSRLLLQFAWCLAQGQREVESFVFGTRLSRVTAQLELRNIDRAIDAASREVIDWAGGTRIGESLRTFNQRWARRVLRRGAVVLIVSDGWERGDVTLLRDEIRSLRRRCHRLIWLNPLVGRPGYEPRVEGIAAVLPHVDDFLPVNDLHSLRRLADHLAGLSPRGRLGAAGRHTHTRSHNEPEEMRS